MQPSKLDATEVVRQAQRRARYIAELESKLEDQREQRAIDARWMVRNTTCSRSLIAAVLGISRVTLDKYLDDGGMTREYMREIRAFQKERGIVLYDSRDLQIQIADPDAPAGPDSDIHIS